MCIYKNHFKDVIKLKVKISFYRQNQPTIKLTFFFLIFNLKRIHEKKKKKERSYQASEKTGLPEGT